MGKKSKMRKVRVFKHKHNKEKKIMEKLEIGTGFFHGWGRDYEIYDDNIPITYTTAIVEFESGNVEHFKVDMVQFLDFP